MKNSQTLQNLEKVLANSYVFQLKLQNYHWNVVSENFKSLHELFAAQYEDVSTAIDEVAERMRALDSKVEGTFENFSKLSRIKSGNKNLDSKGMINDLIAGHQILVEELKNSIKAAQEEGDEVTADLFIGRATAHEKAIWMLKSSS
jgi:starvation-inducible DNA-binding protein